MSKKSLDFFQIYYNKDQIKELYDFATPIFNQSLTSYFENSVIASVVPASSADFISVASWRLKQKRSAFPSKKVLKATGSFELTKELILSTEFDIAILTPRFPEHKMLFMARHWHGQAWGNSFYLLSSFLRNNLGILVPSELNYSIYENHFIARREVYRDYIEKCLAPVIHFMEDNSAVFSQDAGYRARKEMTGDIDSIRAYENTTGRKDWPIGVFLLERLFSIWINEKNLCVINL